MNVELNDGECRDIFASIDIDGSGTIEWAELQLDFDKCITKTLLELLEEERILHLNDDDDDLLHGLNTSYGRDGGRQATGAGASGAGVGMSQMKDLEQQRKIASLEDKVKQAYLELQNENALRNLNEESLKLLQKHHDDLRKQYDFARDEVFGIQMKIKEQQAKIRESISKVDSEKIQKANIALKLEVQETRSALLSYKNMHNIVCEQVKSLKLMHERGKDENESLIQTLRDVQAESFEKQKFAKMYYVVMLSRWQEAAVNKKYDMKINECKELKGEIFDVTADLEGKERDYHKA